MRLTYPRGRGRGLCLFALIAILPPVFAAASEEGAGALQRRDAPDGVRLVYVAPGGQESTIATASHAIVGERLTFAPDADVLFAAWDEVQTSGSKHFVSLSLDLGESWKRPQALTYDILLRAGRLHPGIDEPALPARLRSAPVEQLFIVQFETGGVEAWRRVLARLGVEVLAYLPEHAHVVRMAPALAASVAAQPFVRWVGRYEPGYKIEPEVLAAVTEGALGAGEARRYHLQTFTPGPAEKSLLADEVRALGGRVDLSTPNGYLLDATLTPEQLLRIAHSDHLLWLDRWSPPETDMDIVRQQDGANYIESVRGYSGQGVNGEVMDCGFMQSHQDFDGVRVHGPSAASCDHGTCTYGIVFGNGARDGDGDARATGNLPSAQGWFYDYDNLTDRYQETAELVQAPIFASFQSNSWGDARTRSYTSISSQMDDIIWLYDIPIFQSQSNAGNQDSRPQAWAKNIISIGGVYHYDTLSLADDCWCFGGSTGPAEDGRIKPDLAYWYDDIYTTDLDPGGYSTGVYTPTFGGTSAATPITAGVGGLILQMWADNVLNNNPQGSTVFEKRPHASTTKALMINTAEQYPFSGATHDLTRMHQGWGLPSAKQFFGRASLINVVDEEQLLQEFDVHTYTATVPPGQSEFKVTLVYTDRAGTTSSTLDRINDVSVKVTDPGGATFYWGNYGLDVGLWSVPGGVADAKNTVENVFVQNPAAGAWTIEISADDLNQDEHSETPEVDQDYALVVYGADSLSFGCSVPPPSPSELNAAPNGDNRVDLSWVGTPTARRYHVYRSLGGCGGTEVLIGTTAKGQTTFTDASASGGSAYGYTVRAVEACESSPSNCTSVIAPGPCILPPNFAGATAATGADAAECGVTVQWGAAIANCGGAVVYNVYRGTTAGFSPAPQNRIGSCVTGSSYVDARALQSNQTYYYIVRAEDLGGAGGATCGGAAEQNTVAKSTLARGPASVLLDVGFETGLEGWTPGLGSPAASKGDFVAGAPTGSTSGGQPAQPGACAAGAQCLYTGVNRGNNPDNGDVDGGEVLATSPVINASGYATARLTLSRWHFNSATTSDSGDHFILEASSDDGATWANLETLGPLVSANTWTPVAFDLQTYRPLTAQMRIRVRSADGPTTDSTVESAIDQVHIEGALNCTPVAPAPVGDAAGDSLRVERQGSKLRLSWGSDCGGGTGYGLYRGDLLAGYGSLAPAPGQCGVGARETLIDAGAGSYFFLVAPNNGAVEGSLGVRSDGTPRAQPAQSCYPRADPVNSCAG